MRRIEPLCISPAVDRSERFCDIAHDPGIGEMFITYVDAKTARAVTMWWAEDVPYVDEVLSVTDPRAATRGKR